MCVAAVLNGRIWKKEAMLVPVGNSNLSNSLLTAECGRQEESGTHIIANTQACGTVATHNERVDSLTIGFYGGMVSPDLVQYSETHSCHDPTKRCQKFSLQNLPS